MTHSIQLHHRRVGPHQPVFIIAEIGVNHDGRLDRAIDLLHMAADAGADAAKLQIFRADALMHPSAAFAQYQKNRSVHPDPAAMLRQYELSDEDLQKWVDEARKIGLIPLATPFSPNDMKVIGRLGLPAVKIASPDLVNRPLLAAAARSGLPLILSTGAADMDEVSSAVQWLQNARAAFVLLHCTSAYPTPSDQAHLCWIGELAQRFAVPVGFSDHTTDPIAGALATAAGACIIEKHLTHDRSAPGPDHAASADPGQFNQYVRLIRQSEQFRGHSGKHVLPIEHDVRAVSRQSLILRRDLSAGEAISETDLTVQRPGTGIPAAEIDQTVGRRAVRALPAGTLLQWDMLDNAA